MQGMAVATTIRSGGRIIETWVESCPHCRHDVTVSKEGVDVRCAECNGSFRTAGPATVFEGARAPKPVSLDSPTQIAAPRKDALGDPNDSLIGATLGQWTLLRLIGRGGMGRVYEARGGKKDRRVALKVLGEDLASDGHFVKRFHREAKLLSSLSHPHIVNVIDQGEEDDRLWFAMDYVRGESLRRVIERGTLKAKRATEIASEIAEALSYAHDRGIIHRDLKPENVLLDENGSVHLVDFGLSRLVNTAPGEASTRLTRTDVILGTYEYMAPEQRRGERQLDGRADVFALGVILYEMLTGTLPLGRFTPPSESSRDVARSFDEVVNRALATNPNDRFSTAGTFREALTRALEGKSPTPPPLPHTLTPPPVVPQHRISEARSILKHVEILGALDRVSGILLLLGGLGLFSIAPVMADVPWLPSIGGIVFIIFGLYLMGLGKRVARLQKGAREAQITASVLMLFLPPFLMALGIYGLIVMTSERARAAFRYGVKALRGPEPVFEVQTSASVIEHHPAHHPKSASFLMRGFTLLAIFFSVYLGVIALDAFSDARVYGGDADFDDYRELILAAGAACIYSLLVLIRMFLVRRERRGVGLALTACIFLFTSTTLLNLAVNDAERRHSSPERNAAVRFLPGESFRQHFRPFLHWENSK